MLGSGSKVSLDSDLLKRCREHAKAAGCGPPLDQRMLLVPFGHRDGSSARH
jgi:hypothetical protein